MSKSKESKDMEYTISASKAPLKPWASEPVAIRAANRSRRDRMSTVRLHRDAETHLKHILNRRPHVW